MRKKPYTHIGLGGTFDHFHAGHKHFLDFAARLGSQLTIGITEPKLILHKQYAAQLQSQRERWHSVKTYCKQKQYWASLISLQDTYGNTLDSSAGIQALAVTPDTVEGAVKINEARTHLGMSELPVHVCPLLPDATGNGFIHSTRIRSGQISRSGEVFATVLATDLVLSEKQRAFFQKNQGTLVTEPKRCSSVRAVVGDITLEQFLARGWEFSVGVYDLRSARAEIDNRRMQSLPPHHTVTNPAGTLSRALTETLTQVIAAHQPLQYVKVDGEEDLAAVALALLLPLKSQIYYGQPNEGMVVIEVTESVKSSVYQALKTYAQQ